VELWVRGARGAVRERRGDEALGVDLEDAACSRAGERRVILEEGERTVDRALVRGENRRGGVGLRRSPQHRDRLRRREGEPEPGDDAGSVGEGPAELGAVDRVAPLADQPFEHLRVDCLAGNPERLRTASDEEAGALRGAGVVVLAARRDLLGEVAPAVRRQLHEAHHRPVTPESAAVKLRTASAEVSSTRELSQSRKGL
jgi:hypothetical protein